MYINDYEFVVIKISQRSKSKWENKIGEEINELEVKVHWSHLIGTSFRTNYIKVMCDDCRLVYDRRIRDLDPEVNKHLCRSCSKTGKRNPNYGNVCSENSKIGTKEWMYKNGNPFTWESSKEKIRNKKPWKKAHEANLGSKRTKETRELQSKSALLAFKEGRRSPHSGWAKIHTKEYKGLKYQSGYELNFIKYLESNNKIHLIESGPSIPYVDIDGKERTYFIDFKIKNTDMVFEIKSNYYWNKKLKTNIIKKETASKIYDYYLIMDNNFSEVDKLIKHEKI